MIGACRLRTDELMKGLVIKISRAGLPLTALAVLALLSVHCYAQTATPPGGTIWTVPEVGALPDNDYGRLVRRGRDLVAATYAHIGPEVERSGKALCRQQSRLRRLPP